MNHHAAALGLALALALLPRRAASDEREAALTRAVAAKEIALDSPEPARWQEALDRFIEADTLEASADTKYELGFIAAQLRQQDLALGYYEDAIGFGLEGPVLDKAMAFIRRYDATMARLDVQGKAGTRLRIRGIDRGTLPLTRPLVVYPGVVRLEGVDPSGRRVNEQSLSIQAGQTKRIEIAFVAREPTRPPVLGPPPQLAQDVGQPTSRRPMGVWFLGAGAGLVLSSAIALPLSISKLHFKREQMAGACDIPSDDPDGCLGAKPGRYGEAVDIANDIARWRTVRAMGWAGLGVGAASAALGLVLVTRASKTSAPVSEVTLWPTTEPRLFVLNCRAAF